MTNDLPSDFNIGVITGVGEVELRRVDMPQPGSGQALLRLDACAVCTWEQRTFTGAQSNRFPFVGGHEMVGTVVALGEDCYGPIAVGDRVSIGSASCGSCPSCWTGQDNVCPRHYAGAVSYDDVWGPGGFAEYKLHPADGLYPVGNAPDQQACLVEPLSCAMHSVRLSGVRAGDTVVVIGAGVMGLMNVIAARAHGARVLVTEIDPQRLAKATVMGATEVIDASAVDPVEAVLAQTDGKGADVVFVAIGNGKANDQGLAMLAKRGTLVLFASAHPEAPITIQPNKLHNEEKRIMGVVSSEKQDFYRAAQLVRYGLVDLAPLVQSEYPLTSLAEGLTEAAAEGAYRVIIRPGN